MFKACIYLHIFKDKTLPDQWLLLIGSQVSVSLSVSPTCTVQTELPSQAGHTPKPAAFLWCPLLLAGPYLPKPCLKLVTSLSTLSWPLFTSLCFPFYFLHFSFCINSPVSFSHLNCIFQISECMYICERALATIWISRVCQWLFCPRTYIITKKLNM